MRVICRAISIGFSFCDRMLRGFLVGMRMGLGGGPLNTHLMVGRGSYIFKGVNECFGGGGI